MLYRSFLKWVGGKSRLVPLLKSRFCDQKISFVEPFVGAGVIFLNTDYPRYYLSDINPDLIQLFQCLQRHPEKLIQESRRLFAPGNNEARPYYLLREAFNRSQNALERSALFLYLNRHGYNGLCRYNRLGKLNVPFGSYRRTYFPEAEMYYFAEKARKATFFCESFEQAFSRSMALKDALIYCDPPYAPLARQASQHYLRYHQVTFSEDRQKSLVSWAKKAATIAQQVVWISNHATSETLSWYSDAKSIDVFPVTRTVSCRGAARQPANELLVRY